MMRHGCLVNTLYKIRADLIHAPSLTEPIYLDTIAILQVF